MEEAPSAKQREELSTDRLGSQSVLKLLIEFSIPAVIMMTFNALYNIVDSIFLGQAVGDMGLAVTTLAFPVTIVLMGLSALAGQGGNALAAIRLGEDKVHEVERTLGNTVLLLIIISIIIAVLGVVCIDPILMAIGTTDELYDMTKLFVQIVMIGFAFQCIGMGANNFLRTEGKPVLALITSVLGTVVCIIFNFILVMMLGFGVAGSAFATIIGQAAGMFPVMWYLIKGKDAPFHLRLSCMTPDIKLWSLILSLGLASFIMQIANAIITSLLNQELAFYGALDPVGSAGALAAIGVASRVNSFAFLPTIGIMMGAQTIIGFNFGAQKWDRVLRAFWYGLLFATIFITTWFVVIHVIPGPIVRLFGVSGDLEEFCIYALLIMTALFPLVGFQVMSSNYFQATGQPMKASLLSLTRQVIFLVPSIVLLPMYMPLFFDVTSLQAICFSYPVSDALAVLTTTAFIIPEILKLRKRAQALVDE